MAYAPVDPDAPPAPDQTSNQNTNQNRGDGSLLGPVIGGAAALGTGIANWLGGQSANESNAEQAAINRSFNEQMQYKAWAEQEFLRASNYQATKADMEKAGLNPMYAMYKGGQDTAPGVGAASATSTPTMQNALAPAISSALQLTSTLNDLKSTNADVTLKKAQALSTAASANQSTASARNLEEMTAQLARRRNASGAIADADENDARLRKTYGSTEKILNMIKTGSGITKDATESIGQFLPSGQLRNVIKGLQ